MPVHRQDKMLGYLLLTVSAMVYLAQAAPTKRSYLSNRDDYETKRQELINKDANRATGAGMSLNKAERRIDAVILKEKQGLIDYHRRSSSLFLPAASFKRSQPMIEKTATFKLIKSMPKGGALHVHDIALTSLDWLVKNATYRDHVWMCTDSIYGAGDVYLNINRTRPSRKTACRWKRVKEERRLSGNAAGFDAKIIENLSYLKVDPVSADQDVNKDWDRFNKYFSQILPLTLNAPIMRDYFRQTLQEFYDDGVMYLEVRSSLSGYTELDGTVHDEEFGVQLYKSVTEEFVRDHPPFIGAGVIMSGLRYDNYIGHNVKKAIELHKKYPGFFLGYDLVGKEGSNKDSYNKDLRSHMDQLLYPTSLDPPYNLPYFFHAGETKWQGTEVDENLFDALLLNTSRIGHGYALTKHPQLMEMVKQNNVAVEVNPISNQVLGLVDDFRNHAAAPLLADSFPLVISSDHPASWGALPLSHDFYIALMTMAGRGQGLAFVKQLAENSLTYSAMSDVAKKRAICKWTKTWDWWVGHVNDRLDTFTTEYDHTKFVIYPNQPVVTGGSRGLNKQTALHTVLGLTMAIIVLQKD